MNKEEQVYSLLSDVLGKDAEYLKSHVSETDLWDSLKRIELVFALEEQFEVTFSPAQIAELKTVQNILDIVGKA